MEYGHPDVIQRESAGQPPTQAVEGFHELAAAVPTGSAAPPHPVCWPEDLVDWLGPAGLDAVVQQAVQTQMQVDPDCRCLPDSASGDPRGCPCALLMRLLTSMYARGIYDSESVAARAWSEHSCPLPRDGALLEPDNLRGFRRHTRAVLLSCLEIVLARAWQARQAGTDQCRAFAPALDDARLEARDRLDLAAQVDTLALDD